MGTGSKGSSDRQTKFASIICKARPIISDAIFLLSAFVAWDATEEDGMGSGSGVTAQEFCSLISVKGRGVLSGGQPNSFVFSAHLLCCLENLLDL